MAEVVCLGEALIDFVAIETGVSVGEASGFLKAPGGAPANVAVGVAKLGHTSAFLGKVGDDPFGHFLAQTFAAEGVDTGGMIFSPQYRTGLAFVSLKAGGERDFCFFRNPSADMTYGVVELDPARIQQGKVFHFGSITLIEKVIRETTLQAVGVARAADLLISYDPNLRPALWPNLQTARNTILRAARFADIVKVSEEELLFLMGSSLHEEVPLASTKLHEVTERFLKRCPNVSLLVVTLGERGCQWRGRYSNAGRVPGFPVQAVDTTGAGDGFVAGLLTGLMAQGLTTAEAISQTTTADLIPIFRRANAVGAITTLHKGAIPALPTQAQVEAFIEAD